LAAVVRRRWNNKSQREEKCRKEAINIKENIMILFEVFGEIN
jgi:hypothetical protein